MQQTGPAVDYLTGLLRGSFLHPATLYAGVAALYPVVLSSWFLQQPRRACSSVTVWLALCPIKTIVNMMYPTKLWIHP